MMLLVSRQVKPHFWQKLEFMAVVIPVIIAVNYSTSYSRLLSSRGSPALHVKIKRLYSYLYRVLLNCLKSKFFNFGYEAVAQKQCFIAVIVADRSV